MSWISTPVQPTTETLHFRCSSNVIHYFTSNRAAYPEVTTNAESQCRVHRENRSGRFAEEGKKSFTNERVSWSDALKPDPGSDNCRRNSSGWRSEGAR